MRTLRDILWACILLSVSGACSRERAAQTIVVVDATDAMRAKAARLRAFTTGTTDDAHNQWDLPTRKALQPPQRFLLVLNDGARSDARFTFFAELLDQEGHVLAKAELNTGFRLGRVSYARLLLGADEPCAGESSVLLRIEPAELGDEPETAALASHMCPRAEPMDAGTRVAAADGGDDAAADGGRVTDAGAPDSGKEDVERRWSEPNVIQRFTGNKSSDGPAAMAMNRAGNAVAAWSVATHGSEGYQNLGIAIFRYTGRSNTWTSPLTFLPDEQEHSRVLDGIGAISIDDDGNAWLAWPCGVDNDRKQICVMSYGSDEHFGPISRLGEPGMITFSPRVVDTAEHDVVVAWRQRHPSFAFLNDVWMQRWRKQDGQWQEAKSIGTGSEEAVNHLELVSDSRGAVVATWFESGYIFSNRYALDAGSYSGVQRLYEWPSSLEPAVATTKLGAAMVAWWTTPNDSDAGFDFNESAIWYASLGERTSRSERFWGDARFIVKQDAARAGAAISAPQIALNERGQAIAVWQDQQLSAVFASLFDPESESWSAPMRATDAEPSLRDLDVLLDEHGNATVIWTAEDNRELPQYVLSSTYYRAARGTWTPKVHSRNLGDLHPLSSIDAEGRVLLLWTEGETNTMQSVRFE